MRIPFALRRILQAVPITLGIIVLSFVLIKLAPGDPITMFVGDGGASPEYIAELTRRLGLDRPIHEQLWLYLWRLLQGDLGMSIHQGSRVWDVIFTRAQPTIMLMGFGIAIGVGAGVLMGVYASARPYSRRDNAIIIASLVLYSLPGFWLGQMLILIFSVKLGILPATGMSSFTVDAGSMWLDYAKHLLLPTVTLGASLAAFVMRFVRTSMIEVLGQDYILTARSKGLGDMVIFYKHALRNALLPVVTYVGLRVGHILSGAVVVESVFGWPGLGRLLIDSLFARDYPLIMGMLLVASVSVVLVNVAVDILYSYIDPRIRLQ